MKMTTLSYSSSWREIIQNGYIEVYKIMSSMKRLDRVNCPLTPVKTLKSCASTILYRYILLLFPLTLSNTSGDKSRVHAIIMSVEGILVATWTTKKLTLKINPI